MNQPKISIIVPAYNAGSYIEHCIESIENQTYNNMELILINDGSKDNTKEKCIELQKKYSNIKFIDQKNSGVSETRNKGIKGAKGEYLMFVDSDDFIDNNMLEMMLNNNEDYDLIISNYKKVYPTKTTLNEVYLEKKKYTKNAFLKVFWNLYDHNLINSPCFRLYKREIVVKNNILFNSNYDLGEDLIFNLDYISKCNSFYVIPNQLYNYRYANNSLTTKYRDNYLEIQIDLINYIKQFFITNKKYDDVTKKNLELRICYNIISSIQNLFLPSSKLNKKQIKNKIIEYFELDEINLFNTIKLDSIKLKIIQKLIVKRNINGIILFHKLKEIIKKFIYGGAA